TIKMPEGLTSQTGGIDSIYTLCQLPVSLLVNMSTLGVVQSLEDNPCLGDILLRNNLFQGRDEVLSKLNVNRELSKRNDAAASILIYYNTKYPRCVETLNTEFEKGKFTSNWALFDMICTQDSLINQLSLLSKKEFANIVIDKYNTQLQYPDIFGLSKTTSILILSQLMIKAPFQPYLDALQSDADLKYFATTAQFAFPNILNKVLILSQQFIKN
ncbi:MAG TPA: hypothetical protein PLS50_08810, partial [Candidatus Dojkabacteria bacterium]|nr:hypothetical protein [Candidatus Dojkabacteria bacterium]